MSSRILFRIDQSGYFSTYRSPSYYTVYCNKDGVIKQISLYYPLDQIPKDSLDNSQKH